MDGYVQREKGKGRLWNAVRKERPLNGDQMDVQYSKVSRWLVEIAAKLLIQT